MFSVYTILSLRHLRRHWLRSVLIVASIALGVGVLVATRALNQTMSRAALRAANPLAGTADLIVSNGDTPISRDLQGELASVPGVRAAWPRIFEKVTLPDLDQRAALLMGLDLTEIFSHQSQDPLGFEVSANIPQKAAALLLEGKTPVVVGKELDDALPGPDAEVRVQPMMRSRPATLARAGTVNARGAAAALGGYVLVLDLGSAAKVIGLKPGLVSRLDLILDADADRDTVRKAVEERLAHRGLVRTPEEQDQAAQSAMAAMQTAFSLSGLAALVVGMFLVYNVLAVTAAERRHEIGILLSVGATRGQVQRLFAGEAAFLGLAGSLLGIPLGVGMASAGLQHVQRVLSDMLSAVEATQVDVSFWVVLLALMAGVCTAVTAALIPAIFASYDQPAEAVRRMPRPATWHFQLFQTLASLLLATLGLACILGRDKLPERVGRFGGLALMLLAALVATPLLAGLLARLLQPLARRLLGIEARLAADNLVRAPGRTGLVIAALAAGVALVLQTAGTIRSNREALRDWVRDYLAADLIVTSGSPVGAGWQSQTMEPSLGKEIMKITGVEAALPVSFRKIDYRIGRVFLSAADIGDFARVERHRPVPVKGVELYQQLSQEPGAAIVSDNFASMQGVDLRDPIILASPHGPVYLKVIGKLPDYTWNLGTILMNRSEYLKYWDDSAVDVYDVYVQPGQDVRTVQETILRRLGPEYGLFVLTRAELTERIDSVIERLYGIAYAQQIVVMLVAALGVVMALLISVLQRRHEMGLLRAIGASGVQVIRSVLAEAALMGAIGTAIGMLLGLALLWYVLKVIILEESGFLFPLYVPWQEGLVIAAAALLLATLAGLWPAVFTVRQRIPEAIAYE
jgi:putative ABC transport system permease protein